MLRTIFIIGQQGRAVKSLRQFLPVPLVRCVVLEAGIWTFFTTLLMSCLWGLCGRPHVGCVTRSCPPSLGADYFIYGHLRTASEALGRVLWS